MAYTLSNFTSLFLYIGVFALSAYAFRSSNRFIIGNIICIAFFPVLLGAIRYCVGADFLVYLDGFESLNKIPISIWFSNLDFINKDPIGLYLVAKIAGIFSSSQLYFGILCFLTYLPIIITLKKEWNHIDMRLAAFIYLSSAYTTGLNIIKQTIAISIVFYGLKYIYERNLLKYCIAVFIAFLFHPTAFVALPIYLFWNNKGKICRIKKVLVIVGSIFAIVTMDTITNAMGGKWTYLSNSEGTNNLTFYLMFLWLLVFLYFGKALRKVDKRNELLIIIFAVGTLLQLIGFWSVFGKRIGNYFLIVQVLLMAQLPMVVARKSKLIMKIGIIFYTIALFVVSYLIMGQVGVFPYMFKF